MESMCEFRRYHHTHIIAVGTLFSSLGRMLDSANSSEKIANIICPLDIGNILDLTYLHERLIALIVLRLRLDIRIIPETDDIIVISQLYDRHRHIGSTTDMDEDFWLGIRLGEIELVLEDIMGYLAREARDDEPRILLESRMDRTILWDSVADIGR